MKSIFRLLWESSDLIEKHSQDTNSKKMKTQEEIVNGKLEKLEAKMIKLLDRVDIIENPKLYVLGGSYKGDLMIGAERRNIVIPENHPMLNKSSSYWMNAWEYTLLNPHTEETSKILEFDMNPKFVS